MAGSELICMSCRIVYADEGGECHLSHLLPIPVDLKGTLHWADPAQGGALVACKHVAESDVKAEVTEGTGEGEGEVENRHAHVGCVGADSEKRWQLQQLLEARLEEDSSPFDSQRRKWLHHCLDRLGSFNRKTAQDKAVLKRELSLRRTVAPEQAPIEDLAPPSQKRARPEIHTLTFREQYYIAWH